MKSLNILRVFYGLGLGAGVMYSAGMIYLEISTCQEFIRNYFTDIMGPVRFYAINTTLSTFFLWAIALLFAICMVCRQQNSQNYREFYFYLSQIVLFLYLGIDERFMVHEFLDKRLGISEILVFLCLGGAEFFILLRLAEMQQQNWYFVYLGGGFFALMLFIDICVPPEIPGRLSLEDISKLWSVLFLFAFAWKTCTDKIHYLKSNSNR